MTTTPPNLFPANYAIIIGRLGSFTSSGKSRKQFKTRTKRGDFGLSTQFVILLETPFGEPFELLMDAGSSTPGLNILEAAVIGDVIAVEGALMMGTAVDRRYAMNDEDNGRSVRDMFVRVTTMRAPHEHEHFPQAQVWLEGAVIEPATFVRHGKMTAAQFGRTLLRTTCGPHRIPCDVACLVSTQHELAGYVYQATNRLRLRGDITRLMTAQYGESVELAVAKLQQAWEIEKAALTGRAPDEQRKALVRYRARREALMSQARTFVLVREVMPLDGAEVLSFGKARRERREFVKAIRRNGLQGAREIRALKQDTIPQS